MLFDLQGNSERTRLLSLIDSITDSPVLVIMRRKGLNVALFGVVSVSVSE